MIKALQSGLSFGLTSGIITTLGVLVGLGSETESSVVVVGAILTIAMADSLSDALGVHMFEESENTAGDRDVWMYTLTTFLGKLMFSLSFLIPILLLPLQAAVYASIVWGLVCLVGLSFYIAKRRGESPLKSVLGHLVIAGVVIVAAGYIGRAIRTFLGSDPVL